MDAARVNTHTVDYIVSLPEGERAELIIDLREFKK